MIETILKRRSIRKYKTEPIPDEMIKKILTSAMSAPSARNQQVWHFVVINDREVLNQVPNYHPYSKMLKEAPLAILVCAELELEKSSGYWIQDCSAATMNILLSATSLGLGSVWLGVHPREDRINGLKELFKLPKGIEPHSLIALGYADEEKDIEDRYNEDRIHYNTW